MKHTSPPREMIEIISEKRFFIIFGHTDPDGDCVTSQLVTASVLQRLGKTAVCIAEQPFTRHEITRFNHLFAREIPDIYDPASTAVITLDCSTRDRVAGFRSELSDLPLLMIDHHTSGRPFGTARYIDTSAVSTTVLVHRLMAALGLRPTENEAELLLFGLCTDTGFFRHLEAGSGEALRTAADLVDAGASLKTVHDMIFGGRSLDTRVLLGKVLSRAKALFDGKLVFTYIKRIDLQEHGEEAKDSDTLYALLQGTSGVIVVILVREESDGTLTAGIRTNHTIDAGHLAAQFGGGGHTRAAGLSSTLDMKELQAALVEAAGNMLEEHHEKRRTVPDPAT